MYGMRIKDIINNLKSDDGGVGYAPLMSGLEELDEMVQGFKPGELCVIASRPAMGKTAMILSVAKNLIKSNIPVALFTAIDTTNPVFLSRIVNTLTDKEVSSNPEDVNNVLNNEDMPDLPFYLYSYFQNKHKVPSLKADCFLQVLPQEEKNQYYLSQLLPEFPF